MDEKADDEPVKAWSKDDEDEDEDETKRPFKSPYAIWVDYTEYSTWMGLIYIFFSYQTIIGRIFWIIIMILMAALGLYWCIKAYLDWQDKPVLTTITTTAYSVKGMDFPAVTICSPGMSLDNLEAGFYKLLFAYFAANNVSVAVSPYNASTLLAKNDNSNMTAAEKAAQSQLKTILNGTVYAKFLNESFPGLKPSDDVLGMLKLMTSKNPDSDIAASVAMDGGFDPCDNSAFYSQKRRKRQASNGCPDGFTTDTTNGVCYKTLPDLTYIDNGGDICLSLYDGEIVTFNSDAEAIALFALLKNGALKLPTSFQNNFFLQSDRIDDIYVIGELPVSQHYFPSVIYKPSNNGSDYYCLIGVYDSTKANLTVTPADCDGNQGILCRTYQTTADTCSGPSTFTKQNTFDLLLDPKKQSTQKKGISQKKADFKDMMKRLDQTAAFKSVFSSLWYASMPCYDVKNVTGNSNGERAVLKYCEWKGVAISCAAIFDSIPTDRGICCAFNMKAADKIFQSGDYSTIVKQLQDTDRSNSLIDSTKPKSYLSKNEPTTLPGRTKGLVLMVDAHSDLFAAGSVDTDFDGFLGLINPSGIFPQMVQEGFEIKPGHNNIIALTGSQIDADPDLRDLDPSARKCYFPDENSNMKMMTNYSNLNCILECSILYARSQMTTLGNDSQACIPWYFPSPVGTKVTFCDPWETLSFLGFMSRVPDDQCTQCYPDCNNVIYETSIISVPFRRCDSYNLGISRLCNLKSKTLPQPTKFASQVKTEYAERNLTPAYINYMVSSVRQYASKLPDGDVFTQNPKNYDAFEKDIAMVQIFFSKSTVFQMGSQPRMTWIDYFSTVGGLLGLVLGLGIPSFIEIIWVCCRMLAFKAKLTDWVR